MASHSQDDAFQTAVEKCADEVFRVVSYPKLCIVHFVAGREDEPGAMRKSAVRTRDSLLADLGKGWFRRYRKRHQQADVSVLASHHRAVLSEHIRHMDRRNTFLQLVERLLPKVGEVPASLSLHISDHLKQPRHCARKVTGPTAGTIGPVRRCSWMFDDAITTLMLPERICDYFRLMYESRDGWENWVRTELERKADDNPNWAERFLYAKAAAFGRMYDRRPCKDAWSSHHCWNELGALQSALLYFAVGTKCEAELTSPTQISGSAVRLPLLNDSQSAPLAVAIVAPAIPEESEEQITADLSQILQQHLIACAKQLQSGTTMRSVHPKLASTAEADFDKETSSLFIAPAQQRICGAVTSWMLLVAERLRGTVHEGEPLDFYFVAGDASQFRDHPSVVMADLTDEDTTFLEMPAPAHAERKASAAARLLAKEHFPWFLGGRYALFWDVAQERMRPIGLVRLTSSTWEFVAEQRFADAQSIDIPPCIMVFIKGVTGQAGVVRYNERGKPLRELLRWSKTEWAVVNSDARRTILDTVLRSRVANATWREELIQFCLRVADNPRTGGIILLLRKGASLDAFPAMGRHWVLESTSPDDRIALIAHDGATARRVGDVEWRHRLLLTVDGVSPKARKELVQAAQDAGTEFPLGGAGSRRWSAALAAFRPEVTGLLAMSQDGDIHCWLARNKQVPKGLADVEFLEVRPNGEAREYDHQKRLMKKYELRQ